MRAEGRRFVLSPGHVFDPERSLVVKTDARYTVVEKVGEPGSIAAETDPRT